MAEGIIAVSEDGWITGANRAALEQLGLRLADLGALQLDQVLLALENQGDGGRDVAMPAAMTAPRRVAQQHVEPAEGEIVAEQAVLEVDAVGRH